MKDSPCILDGRNDLGTEITTYAKVVASLAVSQ
jgi:hypothetical protein